MNWKTFITLLLVLSPGLAIASTKAVSAHMRPQLFRDRTPKAHVHTSQPHHSTTPTARAPR